MSEWQKSTLGEIALVQTGPFGSQLKNEQYITGGTPVVTVEHIKDFLIEDFIYPSVKDEDKARLEKYTLKAGDIVFSRVGSVDLSALVKEHQTGWLFSSRMLRVRVKEELDSEFLSYYLRQPDIRQFIINIAVGSTMPSINTEILKSLPISYCSLKTQKEIAAVLSCLDRKIENLRRQNETLERIAQTLFKHWFVDFEFPNEDGKPYKSSGGAMVRSELGEIPADWRVGKLENFCTIFRGSSPRPITSPVFFKNGSIPWIKIADATRSNSIYLSETKEFCTEAALPYTRLLEKGSLILSNSATVGIPMILNLDGCIHDGWLSFKDYKVITRNFLFFVLTNKLNFLVKYADGTVQKNLNTGILKNMDFVVASEDIIQNFTDIVQTLFDKILINEQQIQTLTKTRDVLLPELMSGKLRIIK